MDSDLLDGEHAADIVTNSRVKAHFPDTIANTLSNHSKANHDALNINADLLDGQHASAFVEENVVVSGNTSISNGGTGLIDLNAGASHYGYIIDVYSDGVTNFIVGYDSGDTLSYAYVRKKSNSGVNDQLVIKNNEGTTETFYYKVWSRA